MQTRVHKTAVTACAAGRFGAMPQNQTPEYRQIQELIKCALFIDT
jgi:hypothetical protein